MCVDSLVHHGNCARGSLLEGRSSSKISKSTPRSPVSGTACLPGRMGRRGKGGAQCWVGGLLLLGRKVVEKLQVPQADRRDHWETCWGSRTCEMEGEEYPA